MAEAVTPATEVDGLAAWLTAHLDQIDEWLTAKAALARHTEHCHVCTAKTCHGCDTGTALFRDVRAAAVKAGVPS